MEPCAERRLKSAAQSGDNGTPRFGTSAAPENQASAAFTLAMWLASVFGSMPSGT